MAEGHGGHRTPAKPAAVSGPGKYSKRTDGGPAQVMSAAPDQPYGAMTQEMNDQRVAPMGGTAPMPSAPSADGGGGAAHQMPAYAGGDFAGPSTRPGEPITHGSDIGPGAGPEALSFQPIQQGAGTGQMTAMLQRLSAMDTTGILGQLMQAAQARGA